MAEGEGLGSPNRLQGRRQDRLAKDRAPCAAGLGLSVGLVSVGCSPWGSRGSAQTSCQRWAGTRRSEAAFRAWTCPGEAPELVWGAELMVCSQHRNRVEGRAAYNLSTRAAYRGASLWVPC